VYIELHCHSCYSLREGASTPLELLHRAGELGYPALALTDHDALYGAMEFAKAAEALGIQPITGAEVTLSSGAHLTVLVESRVGYQNLCRLLSWAYQTHGKDSPRITLEALYAHSEGLIVLSGCARGPIARRLAAGDRAGAAALARQLRDRLGPRHFFIELQHNLVQGDRARTAALVSLAEWLGLDCVATGNVHYHVRARHRLQDVLVAIRHRTTLDQSHLARRPNDDFYLKSPAEMAERFAEYPRAVATSWQIAERCQFHLARDLGYQFPSFPVSPGDTEDAFLARLCRLAFHRKYPPGSPDRARASERLEEELRLIARHRLAGFFLSYWRILQLAGEIAARLRGRNPRLPADVRPVGRGRGSSVGSIVCYLIGLSHIDPVANNLFLGRFLNEELVQVPDIDLDFPRDIRAELLERIYDYFGDGRAALVGAFATYRARSAIHDIGKALGLPAPVLAQLAKLSDRGRQPVAELVSALPGFRSERHLPVWNDLATLADQLIGFPRHLTQHVGGVVLASEPIATLVPVEPARMAGRFVLQWDKDSVTDARMVKIDFLALGMLSLVDDCLDLIDQRRGVRIDLGRVDHTDPAVYDQICAGDTIGVFQIESRAQSQTLPRTRPRTLDDLAVQVAIIRPGPVVSGAFHPYMDYRQRLARGEAVDVAYAHPSLEPILRETLGVILYQEQVLQIAMTVAGYTAGEADLLRRAMSRRRSVEAMGAHWPRFREGAARRGIAEATARQIFDSLLGFAAFGFPKAHAVAFALLAYESAWLRHYYPAEYYAALLNNQPMGFYSPEVVVGDARRHGVKVVGPDINRSQVRATVETDHRIRLGLGMVKGIGPAAAERIVARRDQPFRSLFDFLSRTRLPREAAERLILAGAFESFGLSRRALLWQLGLILLPRGAQVPLDLPTEAEMVRLPPMSAWERMAAEFATLGLSPRQHPLALLRPHLPRSVCSSVELAKRHAGEWVRVAGMVVCRQRPETAKGILFLSLEDEFGLINVVVPVAVQARSRVILRTAPFLLVAGRLQRQGSVITVVAARVHPLAVAGLLTPASHDFS
jgi:error-prone DNA polymerase